MTLAKALLERANLKTSIYDLKNRINDNLLVQEGTSPSEDPQSLMPKLENAILLLQTLIKRINITNSKTLIEGESLTALIARRDMLKLKYEAYEEFSCTARRMATRARGTEIKINCSVDYKILQQQLDKTAKELRETDIKIQKANWITLLKED